MDNLSFRFFCWVILIFILTLFTQTSFGIKVAVIEPTQNRESQSLYALLEKADAEVTDITREFSVRTPDLSPYDALFIASFATSDSVVRDNLKSSAKALREYVAGGNVVVVFPQSAVCESFVPWLEKSVFISRSEKTYDQVIVNMPGHILLTEPNKIFPSELNVLKQKGTPLVHDPVLECNGCEVIASRTIDQRDPALIVSGWEKGRIIVSSIPFDLLSDRGSDRAKEVILKLTRNIVHFCNLVKDENPPILSTRDVKPAAGYPYEISGIVFLDKNGNGVKDNDESGLPQIPVSDGQDIVFTNDRGAYVLPNSTKMAKTVYVSIPSGFDKDADYYRVIVTLEQKQAFDFGLRKSANTEEDTFTFVQITDIHVTDEERRSYLENELRVMNAMAPRPSFIVATGDLVNEASHIIQLKNYIQGVQTSNIPVFSLPGNHDRNSGSEQMYNYIQYCGPDYYSFDYADCHFIVYNCAITNELQSSWLRKDIENLGKDKTVVFFQHYPPTVDQISELNALGVDYVFTGHWHSTRIQQCSGLRHYSVPPLYLGGIDISPAGFMAVSVDKGQVTTDFRIRTRDSFLHIACPTDNLPVYTKPFDIIIESYSSSTTIQTISYEIIHTETGTKEHTGRLSRSGKSVWRTSELLEPLAVGSYKLWAKSTLQDGKTITTESLFNVLPVKTVSVQPRVQSEWHQFMGSPYHDGVTNDKVRPPFAYRWSYSTGGWIDFSSPIIAENKLFIAAKRLDDTYEPRILAINIPDGSLGWEKRVQMPVEHTLAYADGKIFGVCQDGTILCLSAADGNPVWSQSLGNVYSRWVYSAPLVADGNVYCGNSASLGAFKGSDGKMLWNNTDGHDWISSYCSPLSARNAIVMGSVWLRGGSLYTMDSSNGKRLWALNSIGFHSSPSYINQNIYCTDTRGILYSLKSEDGSRIWQEQLESGWSTTTPVSVGKCLIAGSGQGSISCYNLETKTLSWTQKTPVAKFNMSPYEIHYAPLLSSPTVASDIVYFGSGGGILYALQPSDGKVLWQHDFGVPIISTPAASGNALFICTASGTIYCLTVQ